MENNEVVWNGIPPLQEGRQPITQQWNKRRAAHRSIQKLKVFSFRSLRQHNHFSSLVEQRKVGWVVGLPRSGGRCLVPRSLTPFHWRPQRKTKFSSAACRSIPSTHLLSLAAHPSISFISFNQFTFWFVNWWRNERLWAHYTATDLRQQIKNYSTIS